MPTLGKACRGCMLIIVGARQVIPISIGTNQRPHLATRARTTGPPSFQRQLHLMSRAFTSTHTSVHNFRHPRRTASHPSTRRAILETVACREERTENAAHPAQTSDACQVGPRSLMGEPHHQACACTIHPSKHLQQRKEGLRSSSCRRFPCRIILDKPPP